MAKSRLLRQLCSVLFLIFLALTTGDSPADEGAQVNNEREKPNADRPRSNTTPSQSDNGQAKPDSGQVSPTSDDDQSNRPDDIRQQQPGFLVRVAVDRPDRLYHESDSLKVQLVSEQDAYAYVIYHQADGKQYQIFPNSVQQQNRIKAETVVTIPAADDQFRWRIGPPFGQEVVRVVASTKPIEQLDDPALREKRFNTIPIGLLKEVAESLEEATAAPWAEDRVEITTYPLGHQPKVPSGRRFGLFVGVSKHQFNEEYKAVAAAAGQQQQLELDLPAADNSAYRLAALLKAVGQLDDGKILLNEQAAKKNFEQAVTEWLPGVSQPGDTVIIVFCGHGGQLPDALGNIPVDIPLDESDGLDEYLVMHDQCNLPMFRLLVEKHRQESPDEELPPHLLELDFLAIVASGVARNLPAYGGLDSSKRDQFEEEFPNAALCRYTSVTDDLFGHWLQRLAGRRLVVIVDSCHSGGLATLEKGADADLVEPQAFDFLVGEIGRLKDIGQPDTALLAASSVQHKSLALRVPDDLLEAALSSSEPLKVFNTAVVRDPLQVMTYSIVKSLEQGKRPLDLEQIYRDCDAAVPSYVEAVNELLPRIGQQPFTPYRPQYFNYWSEPVIIKP